MLPSSPTSMQVSRRTFVRVKKDRTRISAGRSCLLLERTHLHNAPLSITCFYCRCRCRCPSTRADNDGAYDPPWILIWHDPSLNAITAAYAQRLPWNLFTGTKSKRYQRPSTSTRRKWLDTRGDQRVGRGRAKPGREADSLRRSSRMMGASNALSVRPGLVI